MLTSDGATAVLRGERESGVFFFFFFFPWKRKKKGGGGAGGFFLSFLGGGGHFVGKGGFSFFFFFKKLFFFFFFSPKNPRGGRPPGRAFGVGLFFLGGDPSAAGLNHAGRLRTHRIVRERPS